MARTDEPSKAFSTAPRTIAALSRMLELALDEVDLTLPQYRLLGFCANGATTPSEVAVWLSVKKQSVTTQLDVLVRRGYLERSGDEHDRRRTLLTITPQGRQTLTDAEAAIQVYYDVVLSTISASERKAVDRGLANAGRAFTRIWTRARTTSPPRPLTGWMHNRQPRPGD